MAKSIVTVAVYHDEDMFRLGSSILRHYCIEYSDLFHKFAQDIPSFAIEAVKSYAFDEYYFDEGWKDVIVRYVNHRDLDTADYVCSVRPCTSAGAPIPFFKPKSYTHSKYDIKNQKSS